MQSPHVLHGLTTLMVVPSVRIGNIELVDLNGLFSIRACDDSVARLWNFSPNVRIGPFVQICTILYFEIMLAGTEGCGGCVLLVRCAMELGRTKPATVNFCSAFHCTAVLHRHVVSIVINVS